MKNLQVLLSQLHGTNTFTFHSSALVLPFPFSAANSRGISCSSVWYTQYSHVLAIVRTYLWIVRSAVDSPGRPMSVVQSAVDSPGGTCQLCGPLLTPPGAHVSCVVLHGGTCQLCGLLLTPPGAHVSCVVHCRLPRGPMSVVWSAIDSPGGTCQLCGPPLTPPGTHVSCVVHCLVDSPAALVSCVVHC